jgi:putative transposase
MNPSTVNTRNNAAFSMTYHLVLVTKYRRKALAPDLHRRCGEILVRVLAEWRCEAVEFGGEADHVHMLFRAHPALDLSRLVNNLKTVSSRLLRKEFAAELARFYWKPVLWHGAYYVGTVGHADLDTVRAYVERQGQGRWPTKAKSVGADGSKPAGRA